jgi:hypothetical protein
VFRFKRIAPQCFVQLANGIIISLDEYFIDSTNEPQNITSQFQVRVIEITEEEYRGKIIIPSIEVEKNFWFEFIELCETDRVKFLNYHYKVYLIKGGSPYRYMKWFCESYSEFKPDISSVDCYDFDSLIYEWVSNNLGDIDFYLDNIERF